MPDGATWLHEVKYDGYRILARKDGDRVTLFSRSGLDWTARFPAIAEALLSVPCDACLLDGEAAFVLPSGLTDFKSLQEHIDSAHPSIRYFAFDLLSLDGKDLKKEPVVKRRAALAELLKSKKIPNWLVFSDAIEGDGRVFYEQACAAGLEGIVSKRADAPYRSGRSKAWLKIKCHRGDEFVIGGYAKSDVKGRAFSSLLLGTFEDDKLIFAGKVGTGFNQRDITKLAKLFKPLEQTSSSFVSVPHAERKGAVWLEPKLVCAVNYAEWTRDGRLRHPSFQGLREDKPARDVHHDSAQGEEAAMAQPSPAKKAPAKRAAKKQTLDTGDPVFDGVKLSNPDRVLYPENGITKLDLARYYETVAPYMLPYVKNRPISLVRCPQGHTEECFFQRHAMKGMSKTIKEVFIPGGETKKKYLYVDGADGLFGLVQIGVLEIHDWGVKLPKVSEPDHIIFDLDPDEGLDFEILKAAAVEVRDFLDALGFKTFLKATGGKGLHVVAPITPNLGWDEVKGFCKAVADALVQARPDRYTANMAKKVRIGKIFVDYLRNQRGGTAICNYSTRARDGAPVACPLRWDELKALKSGAPYNVKTLPARLKSLKSDPWEGYFQTRQAITVKARKALGLG